MSLLLNRSMWAELPPSRLQDPEDLFESLFFIRSETEGTIGDDNVKCRIRQGHLLHVSRHKLNILKKGERPEQKIECGYLDISNTTALSPGSSMTHLPGGDIQPHHHSLLQARSFKLNFVPLHQSTSSPVAAAAMNESTPRPEPTSRTKSPAH